MIQGLGLAFTLVLAWSLPSFAGTVFSSSPPMRDEDGGTLFAAGSELRCKGAGITCAPVSGRTEITVPGTGAASVIAYGAVGNGTTDDLTAVRSTVAASPDPGTVEFPSGVFLLSDYVASGLDTPIISTVTTATTGGSLANSTSYCYRVTVTNATGEGLPASELCVTTGATGGAHTTTTTWFAVSGATGAKIYGRTTAAELLMATWNGTTWSAGSGTATSWTDTGSVTPAGALPTTANTGGKGILIRGQGPGSTRVMFDNATPGFVLSADTVTTPLLLSDLSILTDETHTPNEAGHGDAGFALNWPLGGNGGVGFTCGVQRVFVGILTWTDATDTWAQGGRIKNSWQCAIDKLYARGRANSNPTPANTYGLYLLGNTDAAIIQANIAGFESGILHDGDNTSRKTGDVNPSEGLQIVNSVLLFNRYCLVVESDFQEPFLGISSSHLNCQNYNVYMDNRREVIIQGVSFYKESTPGYNWTAVQINNGDFSEISHNFIHGAGTGTETGVEIGSTSGAGTTHLTIDDNTLDLSNGGGLASADANAAGITLHDNKIASGSLIKAGTTEANFTILDNLPSITYATLTGGDYNVANGSRQYVSDANATCTGASSTGKNCGRLNGAWGVP